MGKFYNITDSPSVGLLRNVLQDQSNLIFILIEAFVLRLICPLIVSCAFLSVMGFTGLLVVVGKVYKKTLVKLQ